MRSARNGLAAWTRTYARIVNKASRLVHLEPNPMQEEILQVVAWCLENALPIRLIILKPRQKGCSTIATAILYWLMAAFQTAGVIIGGEYSQVKNLWKIFSRYAQQDKFDWGFERVVNQKDARFGNGSTLEQETARDEHAGRSGTYQALIATECAKWKGAGAIEALVGILNCVPFLANTIVILESTASGPAGFFYDYWQRSVTFEEFKAGKRDGYIRIFSPWFAHSDSEDKLTPEQAAAVIDSYTDEEKLAVATYNLHPGQIAWYRRTQIQECDNDPAKMKREFPATPEEAFHSSANNRFHSTGLSLMRQRALVERPEFGILGDEDSRYVHIPTSEAEARVWIYERPIEGCRYILPVDVSTGGLQTEGAKDPDRHAVLVIRAEYYDGTGRFHPPKVVARLLYDCRWELDVLEEWVWRLSRHYGHCLVVPEINKDMGLTNGLARRGANLYERTTDDDRGDVSKPKRSGKYGFNTQAHGENSRDTIISMLASAIRDYRDGMPGIEADLKTVTELEHFVVDPLTGRAEAATGWHDDSVMALCIGHALRGMGTVYRPRIDHATLPKQLREDQRAIGKRRKNGAKARFS